MSLVLGAPFLNKLWKEKEILDFKMKMSESEQGGDSWPSFISQMRLLKLENASLPHLPGSTGSLGIAVLAVKSQVL